MTFKYIRPTKKTMGHTEVFYRNKYIGYFLRYKFGMWVFVTEIDSFYGLREIPKPQYIAETRKKLIEKIKEFDWEGKTA